MIVLVLLTDANVWDVYNYILTTKCPECVKSFDHVQNDCEGMYDFNKSTPPDTCLDR